MLSFALILEDPFPACPLEAPERIDWKREQKPLPRLSKKLLKAQHSQAMQPGAHQLRRQIRGFSPRRRTSNRA